MNEKQTELNKCAMEDLIPVSKWNDFYPYPTKAALRQLIFKKEQNNFNSVVKTIGKRLYISITAFNKWVDAQNKAII